MKNFEKLNSELFTAIDQTKMEKLLGGTNQAVEAYLNTWTTGGHGKGQWDGCDDSGQ